MTEDKIKEHLQAMLAEVGFVKNGKDSMILKEKSDDYAGGWKLKEIEGGLWVAEYGYRCAIDDVCIIDYIFSRKPTRKDILIVQMVEQFENNLKEWEMRMADYERQKAKENKQAEEHE